MNKTIEWQEGDPCVLFTPYRYGVGTATITDTSVERLTKTQIILATGERISRKTGTIKSRDAWSPSTELLPPDDDRVKKARLANEAERCRQRLGRLLDDGLTLTNHRKKIDADAITKAIDAYNAALEKAS